MIDDNEDDHHRSSDDDDASTGTFGVLHLRLLGASRVLMSMTGPPSTTVYMSAFLLGHRVSIVQPRVIENLLIIVESTLVKMPQTQNPEKSDGGRLWVCPHRSVEHHEAQTYFHTLAPTPSDNLTISFSPCSQCDCKKWIRHSLMRIVPAAHSHGSQLDYGTSHFLLWTFFNLFKIKVNSTDSLAAISKHFTPKKVKHTLSKLTIPICSHIRLSDSIVSGCFRPNCLMFVRSDRRYQPCICSGSPVSSTTKHYNRCLDCENQGSISRFMFQAHESLRAGRRHITLQLAVLRDLGPLGESQQQAGWTCHTFNATQTSLLAHVYQEWMAMGIQKHRSAQDHGILKRMSKFDRFRDLLQCVFGTQDSLGWVEDPALTKEFKKYHEKKNHLTLDAVLRQGEASKGDHPVEEEAPPPYTESPDHP